MRVLSISHRMQHRLIDNHTIFNAPAVFDYDAIVVDTGGLLDTIRQAADAGAAFESLAGYQVVNGDSLDERVGIADMLRRRRDEFERALERGAVVAVIMHPPTHVGGIQGMHGLDRYFFLPAPRGVAWDPQTIRAAEGNTLAVVGPGHPFERVLDLLRQDLLYRASLDDRAPGIAGRARVFARSVGGAVLGAEVPVLNGRVVFLPSPRESGSQWLAQPEGAAIVEAMHEMHRRAEGDAPAWVARMDVPGLADLERARDARRAEAERAAAASTEAEAAAAARSRLRDVLWATSEHAMLSSVERLLEILGFERHDDGSDDVRFRAAEGELHVVAGSNARAVDMGPHYRLRRRLDAIIERSATAPRGLVVANGRRQVQPEERDHEIERALRVAAEATGYGVITSRWLFVAGVAALDGLDAETLAAIRARLLETNGVIELADLLLPEADDGEAGGGAGSPEPGQGAATAG